MHRGRNERMPEFCKDGLEDRMGRNPDAHGAPLHLEEIGHLCRGWKNERVRPWKRFLHHAEDGSVHLAGIKRRIAQIAADERQFSLSGRTPLREASRSMARGCCEPQMNAYTASVGAMTIPPSASTLTTSFTLRASGSFGCTANTVATATVPTSLLVLCAIGKEFLQAHVGKRMIEQCGDGAQRACGHVGTYLGALHDVQRVTDAGREYLGGHTVVVVDAPDREMSCTPSWLMSSKRPMNGET